jgi:hypothetical protein
MVAIIIISLLILVLVLGDNVWHKRTPMWVNDILAVLMEMLLVIDAVLIGCKLAKMSGIL